MTTWRPDDRAEPVRIGAAGALRAGLRGAAIAVLAVAGGAAMAVLRLVERPLFGPVRPVTPHITQAVCRAAVWVMGLRVVRHGRPMDGVGAIVANHSSWLDILVLNACVRGYFVSKAEVARWPVVGLLARITGTVFIARDPKEAAAQRALFADRLAMGHRLIFFPEGTSTDGLRVLAFKPTLMAAFFGPGADPGARPAAPAVRVQPASVAYNAPEGADPRFYGWWGGMDLAPHLVQVLAARRQGSVEVEFHPPLTPGDFGDRKGLARASEAAVRTGHARRMPAAPDPAR